MKKVTKIQINGRVVKVFGTQGWQGRIQYLIKTGSAQRGLTESGKHWVDAGEVTIIEMQ